MRVLVLTAAAFVVLCSPRLSSATTDGGRLAQLLAFTDRQAIIAEVGIQEQCIETCTIYTLDLTRPEYRKTLVKRLHVDEGASLLDAYLAALGSAAPEVVQRAERQQPLSSSTPDDGKTLVVGSLVASIHPLASHAGAAPYDANSSKRCDERAPDACDACRFIDVPVEGHSQRLWSCAQPGHRADGSPCDCRAEARVVTLRLTEGSEHFDGQQALIQPANLAQNVMNGPGIAPTIDLALPSHALRAFEAPNGAMLFLGGAGHAPMANGTYFPMVAFKPVAKPAIEPPPEPAQTRAPGELGVVVSEIPPPPRGCQCALSPSTRGPSWYGLGLALILVRRFNRRWARRGSSRSAARPAA